MQGGHIKLDFSNGYCCRFLTYRCHQVSASKHEEETQRSAMNSDPTGWDCLLDRYLGSNRDTSSQVAAMPKIYWGLPSGMQCQSALPQKHHPHKTLHCCTFQGESLWLRLTGTVINSARKQHYAIYCIWKWCLLIEISQSSFDPV